jgi:hypothetical protein
VLTSADAAATQSIISELERAAIARLHVEGALSKVALAGGGDLTKEQDILQTWATWYTDALALTSDIEVGGSSATTIAAITAARQRVQGALSAELQSSLGVAPKDE